MKILLINPSYMKSPPNDVFFSVTGYTIPHLGLGYVASYLETAGFDVTVIECMAQGISNEDIYQLVELNTYKFIGISVYSGNKINSVRILNHIKKKHPDSFVFFGGYTATLAYTNLLSSNKFLDCCIIGEGEITTLELAKCVERGGTYDDISGIAFKKSGEIIVTSPRKLITDLDTLPFPKRVFYSKRGEATIVSSRGCLNSCLYCAINAYYQHSEGKKFRFRTAENIINEIRYMIRENPNIKAIGFYDDNFLVNTKENNERINKLINLIRKYNLDYIDYYITVCADDICLNSNLLILFKEVGLKRVFVGIESFVERQLKYYRKKASVNDNIKALRILKEIGLEVSLGFVPYDPYVTIDEIIKNFTVVKEENPLDLSVDIDMPYSLSSALIAVPDTAFKKELEDTNQFVMNDRGYVFINGDVESFYHLKNKWVDSITDLIDKLFYLLIARDHDVEEYERLKILKAELIKIDIDFLLSLCTYVKTEINKREEWNSYLNDWLSKVEHIQNSFNMAEIKYKGIWENEYKKI